jgi:hypothetical protein
VLSACRHNLLSKLYTLHIPHASSDRAYYRSTTPDDTYCLSSYRVYSLLYYYCVYHYASLHYTTVQTVITAVGRVDDNGSRHLVGDVFGNMHVIVLSPDAGNSLTYLSLYSIYNHNMT